MKKLRQLTQKTINAAKRLRRKIFPEVIRNEEYDLKFNIKTDSDRYVCNEIFGEEDAYRRKRIIPVIDRRAVIEIGAHKGFFTLLAAKYAERVIAFEPDAENFKYLQSNIKLNNSANITAVNKAVSDKAGVSRFTVSDATAARHTFFESDFSGAGSHVEVQCTTLNSVFETYEIDRLGLLKLDCEGSEYDILYSADKSLFERIDAIALEIHEIENLDHKKSELQDFLENLGYKADVYDERWLDSLHVWMAFFTRS